MSRKGRILADNPVACYLFEGNFASEVAGVPDLTPVYSGGNSVLAFHDTGQPDGFTHYLEVQQARDGFSPDPDQPPTGAELVTAGTPLAFYNGGPFSVTFWWRNLGGSGFQSNGSESSGQLWGANDRIGFRQRGSEAHTVNHPIRNNSGSGFIDMHVAHDSSNPTPWFHDVLVYDGSQARLYRDGVEIASQNGTGTPADNVDSLTFGFQFSAPTGGTRRRKGTFHTAAWAWYDYVLTPQQIADQFDGTALQTGGEAFAVMPAMGSDTESRRSSASDAQGVLPPLGSLMESERRSLGVASPNYLPLLEAQATSVKVVGAQAEGTLPAMGAASEGTRYADAFAVNQLPLVRGESEAQRLGSGSPSGVLPHPASEGGIQRRSLGEAYAWMPSALPLIDGRRIGSAELHGALPAQSSSVEGNRLSAAAFDAYAAAFGAGSTGERTAFGQFPSQLPVLTAVADATMVVGVNAFATLPALGANAQATRYATAEATTEAVLFISQAEVRRISTGSAAAALSDLQADGVGSRLARGNAAATLIFGAGASLTRIALSSSTATLPAMSAQASEAFALIDFVQVVVRAEWRDPIMPAIWREPVMRAEWRTR